MIGLFWKGVQQGPGAALHPLLPAPHLPCQVYPKRKKYPQGTSKNTDGDNAGDEPICPCVSLRFPLTVGPWLLHVLFLPKVRRAPIYFHILDTISIPENRRKASTKSDIFPFFFVTFPALRFLFLFFLFPGFFGDSKKRRLSKSVMSLREKAKTIEWDTKTSFRSFWAKTGFFRPFKSIETIHYPKDCPLHRYVVSIILFLQKMFVVAIYF